MRTHLKMLFCPDLGLLQDPLHRQWVVAFATNVLESKLELTVLLNQNNEELAQESGLLPAEYQAPTSTFPNYDLALSDTRREHGWESEFRQFEQHEGGHAFHAHEPRCLCDRCGSFDLDGGTSNESRHR